MNGQILKQLREAKNLTVEELATSAEMSRQALWGIETGKSDPKSSTVQKLANVLGVSPSIFYDKKVNSTELPKESA